MIPLSETVKLRGRGGRERRRKVKELCENKGYTKVKKVIEKIEAGKLVK